MSVFSVRYAFLSFTLLDMSAVFLNNINFKKGLIVIVSLCNTRAIQYYRPTRRPVNPYQAWKRPSQKLSLTAPAGNAQSVLLKDIDHSCSQ